MKKKLQILFYIPNIIDYFRLILIALAWFYIDTTHIFLPLYIIQIFLDFFDGYFARKLSQISSLGSWLDVVLDNIGRGILWTYVSRYGFLVSVIEWIVFSFTQKTGARWKETFEKAPFLVRQVFRNNFRTPLGITAISAGLQGLPIMLYVLKNFSYQITGFNYFILIFILFYCVFGRVICFLVELFVIWKNLLYLVEDDVRD